MDDNTTAITNTSASYRVSIMDQREVPPAMRQPTKYDPPESVVPYAFRELLDRLRRARTLSSKPAEINDEERKAFEYGVSQRKRVLEHTLFLVFGQWALYRQAVSGLQSRGLRILYGVGSVVSTTAFIRNRASKVSADMFANIVTAGLDSSLGNEARIILAELEGPDGPYFRNTCRERGFEEDLVSVVAQIEASGDPQYDLHPQLRLKPRLLSDVPLQASLPVSVENRKEQKVSAADRTYEAMRQNRHIFTRGKESSVPSDSKFPKRFPIKSIDRAKDEERPRLSGLNQLQKNPSDERDENKRRNEGNVEHGRIMSSDGFGKRDDNLWGKPFDFSSAVQDDIPDHFPEEDFGQVEGEEDMTPSQRRAFERQKRRRRARAKRGEGNDLD